MEEEKRKEALRRMKETLIGLHNEIKKDERESKEKKDGFGYLITHNWCEGFKDALEMMFGEAAVVRTEDGDIQDILGLGD